MLDLQSIKDRLALITPSPWKLVKKQPRKRQLHVAAFNSGLRTDFLIVPNATSLKWPEDDANFIAHAPTDIEALLAEVERLQNEVEYLNTARKGQRIINETQKDNLDKALEEVKQLRSAIQNHKDRTTLIGPECSCSNEDLWKVLDA